MADFTREESEKIEELQIIERQIHSLLVQKQPIQVELNEINNALEELEKSGDEIYRIILGIMIKTKKENVKKSLNEKKKILDMKIKSIEKQEELLQKNYENLKKEVNKFL